MAKLVLCKGVELEPNYEHTFDFPNSATQEGYFASKKYKEYDSFLQIKDRNTSLFKGIIAKENYDYVKVPEYIDNVRDCTYMYWQNDTNSKIYYAFITNSYYVNEETSIVEYELDVMQTFLFDYKIESAYIDREHQDRFNNVQETSATKVYNILTEKLNAGSDYIIKGNDLLCKKFRVSDQQGVRYKPIVWVTILATESLIAGSTTPSQYLTNGNLYVYLLPYVIGQSNTNGAFTMLNAKFSNGTTYGLWSIQGLIGALLNDQNYDKIHQITISGFIPDFDHISIDYDNSNLVDLSATTLYAPRELIVGGVSKYVIMLTEAQTYNEENMSNKLGIISNSFYNTSVTLPVLANRKTMTPTISLETKLDVYPYKVVQLCHNNNSVDLKLENIKSRDIYGKCNIYGAYSYLIYNKDYAETTSIYDTGNLGYKYGLATKSINDLPLTTDPYLEYMLTKNSQAITGMAVNAGKGLITSLGGFSAAGLGLGAAAIGAGGALPIMLGLGAMTSGFLSGAGAIESELAKRDDLDSTPPALNSLANDGTFSVDSKTLIPVIQYMQIKDEYREQLYQYFRLYGYKANRACYATWSNGTITKDNMNLKSRYYFNYIKCTDINIELNYNRDFHDKIVAIFKKGLTFWHYRSDTMSYLTFRPFNYTYENIEMSALS